MTESKHASGLELSLEELLKPTGVDNTPTSPVDPLISEGPLSARFLNTPDSPSCPAHVHDADKFPSFPFRDSAAGAQVLEHMHSSDEAPLLSESTSIAVPVIGSLPPTQSSSGFEADFAEDTSDTLSVAPSENGEEQLQEEEPEGGSPQTSKHASQQPASPTSTKSFSQSGKTKPGVQSARGGKISTRGRGRSKGSKNRSRPKAKAAASSSVSSAGRTTRASGDPVLFSEGLGPTGEYAVRRAAEAVKAGVTPKPSPRQEHKAGSSEAKKETLTHAELLEYVNRCSDNGMIASEYALQQSFANHLLLGVTNESPENFCIAQALLANRFCYAKKDCEQKNAAKAKAADGSAELAGQLMVANLLCEKQYDNASRNIFEHIENIASNPVLVSAKNKLCQLAKFLQVEELLQQKSEIFKKWMEQLKVDEQSINKSDIESLTIRKSRELATPLEPCRAATLSNPEKIHTLIFNHIRKGIEEKKESMLIEGMLRLNQYWAFVKENFVTRAPKALACYLNNMEYEYPCDFLTWLHNRDEPYAKKVKGMLYRFLNQDVALFKLLDEGEPVTQTPTADRIEQHPFLSDWAAFVTGQDDPPATQAELEKYFQVNSASAPISVAHGLPPQPGALENDKLERKQEFAQDPKGEEKQSINEDDINSLTLRKQRQLAPHLDSCKSASLKNPEKIHTLIFDHICNGMRNGKENLLIEGMLRLNQYWAFVQETYEGKAAKAFAVYLNNDSYDDPSDFLTHINNSNALYANKVKGMLFRFLKQDAVLFELLLKGDAPIGRHTFLADWEEYVNDAREMLPATQEELRIFFKISSEKPPEVSPPINPVPALLSVLIPDGEIIERIEVKSGGKTEETVAQQSAVGDEAATQNVSSQPEQTTDAPRGSAKDMGSIAFNDSGAVTALLSLSSSQTGPLFAFEDLSAENRKKPKRKHKNKEKREKEKNAKGEEAPKKKKRKKEKKSAQVEDPYAQVEEPHTPIDIGSIELPVDPPVATTGEIQHKKRKAEEEPPASEPTKKAKKDQGKNKAEAKEKSKDQKPKKTQGVAARATRSNTEDGSLLIALGSKKDDLVTTEKESKATAQTQNSGSDTEVEEPKNKKGKKRKAEEKVEVSDDEAETSKKSNKNGHKKAKLETKKGPGQQAEAEKSFPMELDDETQSIVLDPKTPKLKETPYKRFKVQDDKLDEDAVKIDIVAFLARVPGRFDNFLRGRGPDLSMVYIPDRGYVIVPDKKPHQESKTDIAIEKDGIVAEYKGPAAKVVIRVEESKQDEGEGEAAESEAAEKSVGEYFDLRGAVLSQIVQECMDEIAKGGEIQSQESEEAEEELAPEIITHIKAAVTKKFSKNRDKAAKSKLVDAVQRRVKASLPEIQKYAFTVNKPTDNVENVVIAYRVGTVVRFISSKGEPNVYMDTKSMPGKILYRALRPIRFDEPLFAHDGFNYVEEKDKPRPIDPWEIKPAMEYWQDHVADYEPSRALPEMFAKPGKYTRALFPKLGLYNMPVLVVDNSDQPLAEQPNLSLLHCEIEAAHVVAVQQLLRYGGVFTETTENLSPLALSAHMLTVAEDALAKRKRGDALTEEENKYADDLPKYQEIFLAIQMAVYQGFKPAVDKHETEKQRFGFLADAIKGYVTKHIPERAEKIFSVEGYFFKTLEQYALQELENHLEYEKSKYHKKLKLKHFKTKVVAHEKHGKYAKDASVIESQQLFLEFVGGFLSDADLKKYLSPNVYKYTKEEILKDKPNTSVVSSISSSQVIPGGIAPVLGQTFMKPPPSPTSSQKRSADGPSRAPGALNIQLI